MGIIKLNNQEDVYNSFSDLYEKIINDKITMDKAENALKALSGMNQTYLLEIKRTELLLRLKETGIEFRDIEIKSLEEKNVEEGMIQDNQNPYAIITQINEGKS